MLQRNPSCSLIKRASCQGATWRFTSPCLACTWISKRKIHWRLEWRRVERAMEELYAKMVGLRVSFAWRDNYWHHRNRGELAEGWYDPATLDKARRSAEEEPAAGPRGGRESPDYTQAQRATSEAPQNPPVGDDDDEDEDDEYGPSLPQARSGRGGHKLALQSQLCKILSLKEVRSSTSPQIWLKCWPSYRICYWGCHRCPRWITRSIPRWNSFA
jgi:hypothetical protein